MSLAKELVQKKDDEQILEENKEYFEMTNLTDKRKERIVSHMVNGIRRHYRVEDDMMLTALTVSKPQMLDNIVMKALNFPKRMLTYGATFGPAFKIANGIRDTTSVAMTHKNFNPFVDSFKGLWGALVNDQDYIRMMAAMGGFETGYVNESDPAATAKSIRKQVKGRNVLSPMQLLDFWEKIGGAVENASRLGLYKRRKDDRLQAAFDARDVMDFHLTGAADSVRVLNSWTPFLNARIQGLYKLGRAAHENPARILTGLGIIGAATAALWYARDEEEWEELEDWDKWTYWHVWVGDEHFRIPKPFELSAVPNAVEVMLDVLNGQEDFDKVGEFVFQTIWQTFNMGDVPAAVKPLAEQWANKSFFTKRAIVSQGLEGLMDEAESRPWTSETLKLIGKETGISPLRLEHLIKGYTSTIGEAILVSSDAILGWADSASGGSLGIPKKPEKGKSEIPMVGRFWRSDVPRHTKFGTKYYEIRNDIQEIYKTVQHYAKEGNMEDARELAQENKWKLKFRKAVSSIDDRLGLLRKKSQKVYQSKNLSPKEKKRALDEISKRQTTLQRKFYEFYRTKQKESE
jgi:hypothetical protein